MFRNIILIFLLGLFSNYVVAQDSNRVDDLEKRVTELEESLAQMKLLLLAAMVNSAESSEEPEGSEKWQVQENWRKLEVGQKPEVVKDVLGEPTRIEGGTFTKWQYGVGAHVIFYQGVLDRWSEPR